MLFYVDCTGLAEGTYTLPVQVETSNETAQKSLQSVSPQVVTVTLEAEAMSMLPDAGEFVTTEMQSE